MRRIVHLGAGAGNFLERPVNVVPPSRINTPGGPNASPSATVKYAGLSAGHVASLEQKRQTKIRSTLVPELAGGTVPLDSRPVIITPNPFVAYPAPGAPAVDVISYLVPAGLFFVVNYLAIIHEGGGFVDGSGNIIWRVKINGAGIKGLNNLTSQVGSWAQPVAMQLSAKENDLIEVTVEVPAAAMQPPVPGMTTAARLHGYQYPIAKTQ